MVSFRIEMLENEESHDLVRKACTVEYLNTIEDWFRSYKHQAHFLYIGDEIGAIMMSSNFMLYPGILEIEHLYCKDEFKDLNLSDYLIQHISVSKACAEQKVYPEDKMQKLGFKLIDHFAFGIMYASLHLCESDDL